MNLNSKIIHKIKYILFGITVGLLLFVFSFGIAEKININPIKPVKNQAITDEQQAILAVRKAKVSVVNIVGLSKPQAPLVSLGLTAVAVPQEVSGTGVVLESDGLIVTNSHVVNDPNFDYTVFLADGSNYPSKILAMDKFDDLAFLKIDATGLTSAILGDSESLETGQTVFAIGNSLGRYQNSVTRGVVSGLGRIMKEIGEIGPRLHNLIQTDAAISRGNSGGPLINLAGEVVGINTLIDTAGASLNFAVPINVVKDSLSQLKIFGKISKPFLGVQFSTIDSVLAISLNLAVKDGALINGVAQSSPADIVNLKAGDIVIEINGQKLDYNHELDTEIQKYQAGNQVMLKILRKNGELLDLPVILGEYK